jgi:hypothetical protein
MSFKNLGSLAHTTAKAGIIGMTRTNENLQEKGTADQVLRDHMTSAPAYAVPIRI